MLRTTKGADVGWTSSLDDITERLEAVGTSQPGELSMLIGDALEVDPEAKEDVFLLVVTDGLGTRSKKPWAEVHRAAKRAGIPVLVAGIWSEDFPAGLRKELRKLAAATGGAVFYVQGPGQADDLVERFGDRFTD